MAGLDSIIIVAHNSGATLSDCVARVLGQGGEVEVIVVDNASVDGAVDALADDVRLRRIHNADNPGFSAACNRGAGLAKGERLLFLNPDCLLPPGALQRLGEHLDADPGLALLGAQLLDPDGRPQAAARRSTPTPSRVLGQRWRRPETPVGDAPVQDVEAISGALMAMRRSWFERLGGFDAGYRLHCEDLDLCRRALLAGGRLAIAADVRPIHLKGSSSRRRPIWVEWHKHRGMLRYFRKFDAAGSPLWLRAAVPFGIALRFPIAAARAWWRARRAT